MQNTTFFLPLFLLCISVPSTAMEPNQSIARANKHTQFWNGIQNVAIGSGLALASAAAYTLLPSPEKDSRHCPLVAARGPVETVLTLSCTVGMPPEMLGFVGATGFTALGLKQIIDATCYTHGD